MSVWVLLQIAVNLVLFVSLFVMWLRLKRPPQDDPRLSKGLQLLQSKISVLEDLSDRTEVQVKQLNALIDEKTKQIHKLLTRADEKQIQVHQSMKESLKVAEIFQDKIPHEEIIERQNTVKYVKAARLAHKGMSVEEISSEVDLPVAELEFISKVNKDQLMFNEDLLPAWAATETSFDSSGSAEQEAALEKISQQFKDAVVEFEEKEQRLEQPSPLAKMTKEMAEKIKERTEGIVENAASSAKAFTEEILAKSQLDAEPKIEPEKVEGGRVIVTDEPLIRDVQFPKIDVNKNLG